MNKTLVFIDDEEPPLKHKEQQDHELSDVQPKHQRQRLYKCNNVRILFGEELRLRISFQTNAQQ